MYRITITLLSLLLPIVAFSWELEKDDKGIKVYTQSMSDSSFKAFRGEMYVQAPLKKILSNHLDAESMTEWLQDCTKSELISKINDQEFIVYQRTQAPWPVSDRDYVMKAKISQDETTFVVTMDFEATTDAAKHDDECVQVTKLVGFWRFTPSPPDGIFIEYETHADPSGSIPSWLANQFVVDQPYGTLTKLRDRITNSTNDLSAEISFIKEPSN